MVIGLSLKGVRVSKNHMFLSAKDKKLARLCHPIIYLFRFGTAVRPKPTRVCSHLLVKMALKLTCGGGGNSTLLRPSENPH